MFPLATLSLLALPLAEPTEPPRPAVPYPSLERSIGWWLDPDVRFLPDLPLQGPGPAHDECEEIAQIARLGALTAARADYLFEVGKCANGGGRVWLCAIRRMKDYREARDLAHAQYRARLSVCKIVGGGRHDPHLDPKEFSAKVTNKYFPLVVGRTLVYEKKDEEGLETIEVTTLDETREIADIECAVVRDIVKLDGVVIEDTIDWYAQRRNGDVWYIGEIARNFEDGLLDNLDGSWRKGKDGAVPGILMKTRLRRGDGYRQEFLLNEAEDVAIIRALDETVTVRAGTFRNCLKTEDFTPLEPGVREFKYYAPGIGVVLEVNPDTGDRTELVKIIDR